MSPASHRDLWFRYVVSVASSALWILAALVRITMVSSTSDAKLPKFRNILGVTQIVVLKMLGVTQVVVLKMLTDNSRVGRDGSTRWNQATCGNPGYDSSRVRWACVSTDQRS